MTRTPLLALLALAALIGSFAALYTPAHAGARFHVRMFPPPGNDRDIAHLHCNL